MQVFGWIAEYIIKKKIQTLKQISHCRPTSLASWSVFLVLTSHWAKMKRLLAKNNFEFLKNWHMGNKPENFDG